MKILICEDNVIVAMSLEMAIEDAGHRSLGFVSSSADCRAKVAKSRPDLVLVDLDLADGPTGPALVEHLADLGIPSIVVSGQAETAPVDRAAACLSKPVTDARLVRAIAGVTAEPAWS